jgi:hypothetical protein
LADDFTLHGEPDFAPTIAQKKSNRGAIHVPLTGGRGREQSDRGGVYAA